MTEQTDPSFRALAPEDTEDFIFVTEENDRNDRPFLFFRQLARTGIFVDLLYLGTQHQVLINTAGSVPSVQKKLGPSINFHITIVGRVRLDGKMDSKEILAAMMRRAAAPFNAIQMSRQTPASGSSRTMMPCVFKPGWHSAKERSI